MASMSVSGIVSGMDWESMIDEIITNAAKPAQPQVSKKTDLTNKKSLLEEMKVTMNSLQSSLSPLKLPSTYKAKTIDIERLDSTSSYKGVLTATVNADAEVNVWEVKVNQLATAQVNRSKQITASSLSSTLNGVTGSIMYVEAAGQKVGIEVKSNDTLDSLKSRINTTLKTLDNPIHVTASVVDNKLILKSDNTGLGTYTAEETIRYGGNGINRLTDITIDNPSTENVKITANGKSYTYGTDFAVANGNEIRWKQYDQSKQIALDDTVEVKYTMDKDDVYTKTGTFGTDEATISGFTMTDNGTLANRVKIKDQDGIEYVYGKDFTITDGKVVWLEDTTPTTNEPASYTVSYSKTNTATYSTGNIDKGATTRTYTDEPDAYIVKYEDKAKGSYDVTSTKSATYVDDITLDFSKLSELYKNTANEDLQVLPVTHSSGNISYIIDPSNRSLFTVSSGSTTYEYGKDFVIRTKNNVSDTSTSNWEIVWAGGNVVTDYARAKSTSFGTATPKPASGSITFSIGYDYDYTKTARVNASDNDKLLTTVFGSDFDMDSFKLDPTKLTIRGYTYGTDYIVDTNETSPNYGEIQWLDKTETVSSIDDALTDAQFTSLQNAYNTANGTTAIPTVTLTDANGVLRTYLDPADTSAFTMKSGSNTYEYGKDYVIRVNDDRTGYVVSWAITEDANADGTTDINDANTAVTTYTQYKKLTTYGMKAAPATTASYALAFSGNYTTSASGNVNKTDTNKSLSTVLGGVTVASSDYASTLTISDGTKTYAYGTDWTIDSSGNITWLEKSSGTPTSYTATYANPSITITGSNASARFFNLTTAANGFPKYSDFEKLYKATKGTDVPTVTASGLTYIADESFFSVPGYTYGEDFVVIKEGGGLVSTIGDYSLVVAWAPDDIVNNYPNKTMSSITTHTAPYTISMQSISSGEVSTDSGKTLANVLGLTNLSDMSKVTITAGGNTYNYNSTASTANDLAEDEYFLDNGIVVFGAAAEAPKRPEGKTYTLTYEAFDALTADATYDGTSTQSANIEVDTGKGNVSGKYLSYEQILSDNSLTSSSSADDVTAKFKDVFSLSDGTNTYTYGTDYTIIQGSDTGSTSGGHNVLINWLTSGTKPSSNASLKLTYTGRGEGGGEVITTSGVKRTATDTINAVNSAYPSASDFSGGTNTITYGGKTFYENVDFTIANDSDGHAAVSWIKDSEGGYEWYYPTSNSIYTITHTDTNGTATSYTASRTGSATLNMSDYGLTTAGGTISVKNGDGLSYKLNAPDITYEDGTSATIAEAIKASYGIEVTPTTGSSFTFNWSAPTLTSRTGLPTYGEELKVEYEYDANTFDLSDDSNGDLLYALGFVKDDKKTYDDYTKAQDAELEIDGSGQKIYRASNDIGEAYDNELIKGVTLHLKGKGTVSLDISHDAEKAVESIQTFVDTYNDLMTWMNTRMTEKQVDKDTAATIDSDDFRMRWGLLHGNSLLRNTKSQMRSLTSQNFTFSFTQRKSSEEVYGTMAFNGLKTSSTLRLRIGTKYVDVTIDPSDTLETIVKKLNDDTKNGPMHNIYYDDNGEKLRSPLLKASVENDMLVINSTSNDEITMSGSAAMNALKMNYTYKGLYQIGLESTSEDYGKSGELVFDANEFMEALEDNPDEVQALMMKFVGQFDTWTKSMLNSSASGETSGTLTREIENIQSRIDSINEYLEKYQDRLDRMEENLRTRYGNTETQFAKLSQQANSIAAILNQLNGTSTGGGYGQTSS